MRYVILIYDTETADPSPEPADPTVQGEVMGAYNSYTQMLRDRGAFLAGEALQPDPTAATLRQKGGQTITTCMTREMVESHEMPSQRGDCKATKHERSGNKLKVAFTCSKASGEGEYTFTSPEAFTMKMTMHTTIQGKQETMNMEGSGKWLSADCGNVKPMYPSKK